jgi:hypothetical protein
LIDTLPVFYIYLTGGGFISLPDSLKKKNLEDVLNYNSSVGSPSILRDQIYALVYPFSISASYEYLNDSAYLSRASYLSPLSLSLGSKVGGYFLQIDGRFWGSYIDKKGDYQVYLGKASLYAPKFSISTIYTLFQRSAYIGSYPYGDRVLDFYERWIYFGNYGFEVAYQGEFFNYFSGFGINPKGAPIWTGFSTSFEGFKFTGRQISYLGTTVIPVRVEGEVGKVWTKGNYNIHFDLFLAYVFSAKDFRRGLILENFVEYREFSEKGEKSFALRWFVSKGGKFYGVEPRFSYTFAGRVRPEIFLGYLYPERTGVFFGVSFKFFRRKFTIAYKHTNRSIYGGLEVGYAKFGL